ncbi:MAG: helix-turn-helix domain-containing protein [Candidatus Amulumruptor sp.]|nr:helix-turn-helix domain-containing protein [Candidatus Amulumruptor sp.]
MVRAWRESDTPRLMRLTDAERKAMEILQRDGSLTVESVARAAAISHSTAADILVGLHSLGLVSFRYTHGAFLIVPAD